MSVVLDTEKNTQFYGNLTTVVFVFVITCGVVFLCIITITSFSIHIMYDGWL